VDAQQAAGGLNHYAPPVSRGASSVSRCGDVGVQQHEVFDDPPHEFFLRVGRVPAAERRQ